MRTITDIVRENVGLTNRKILAIAKAEGFDTKLGSIASMRWLVKKELAAGLVAKAAQDKSTIEGDNPWPQDQTYTQDEHRNRIREAFSMSEAAHDAIISAAEKRIADMKEAQANAYALKFENLKGYQEGYEKGIKEGINIGYMLGIGRDI